MKRQINAVLALTLLCGCSSSKAVSTASSAASASSAPLDQDTYTAYTDSIKNQKKPVSYTAAVNNTYKMAYSDDSTELFSMDGTLAAENTDTSQPNAHYTQHISSKGTESNLDGYYYGGRLYNTYNDVNYYEDMSFSNLKSSLLVPLDTFQIQQNAVDSITANKDTGGNTIYTIKLKADTAASLFTSRYDSYGLSSMDGYAISDNTITDTFNQDGYFVKEETAFTASVTYQSQTITVNYTSSLNYLKLNSTSVSISDEDKSAESAYVNYKDIDTSAISTESAIDDSAESTTEATFKKRLVGRLSYTDNGDGTYTDSFNDNESYTIDFNNKTFKYSNYSITYSYSWKGNTGSMGACTLVFDSNASSTDCEDSTLSTIKDVKTYLEMELYYCGLSLEDLQAEAK